MLPYNIIYSSDTMNGKLREIMINAYGRDGRNLLHWTQHATLRDHFFLSPNFWRFLYKTTTMFHFSGLVISNIAACVWNLKEKCLIIYLFRPCMSVHCRRDGARLLSTLFEGCAALQWYVAYDDTYWWLIHIYEIWKQ